MSLHVARLDAEASSGFRWISGQDPAPLTACLDECQHEWGELVDGERRCHGRCRVVLIGTLASTPPERGIDWSRSVLVTPGSLLRRSER